MKKRRRKIKAKGVLRLFIILTLTILTIYMMFIWNKSDKDVTYTLEYGEIHVNDIYRAMIIRDEKVVLAPVSGRVLQVSDDGDKVKRNQRVMEITGVDGLEALTEKPLQVADFFLSKEQVDAEIEGLKVEIASAIQDEVYVDVKHLSEELRLKIEKKANMNDQNDDEQVSSETSYSDELNVDESYVVTTNQSGLITYFIDGYEDEFSYDNVFNLQFDQIENAHIEPILAASNVVVGGEPLYKIVDDSSYYLIILTENGIHNEFDIRSELSITTANKEVSGVIEEIFAAGTKVAVAIKVEEHIEDFHKNRFVNIQVRQETYKGLTIKTSSLIKDSNGYSVLVVNKLNKVILKPVKIINYDGENAVVKENAFYDIVEGESVVIDSVSIFDRVIVDAEKYSEGDMIK